MWTAPQTDISTGNIEFYEVCYEGEFTEAACDKVDASELTFTITHLHPWVEYSFKIRVAVLLGYGPFTPVQEATTLAAGTCMT